MIEHPVALLRARLAADFREGLPEGVHPVLRFCGEPQFFPGASGLLRARSWGEVMPGAGGVATDTYPDNEVRVMVLGNYQSTRTSYERILAGEIGGFPTTWRRLRLLLDAVPPTQVFLTNAYIGLPDLDKDTAPFPTDPDFEQRCKHLLAFEINLFRPACLVCLGVPAAKMLAGVACGLEAWQPWPGYPTLFASSANLVLSCQVGDARFTAVAVRHPSAVISTAERQIDAACIAKAIAIKPPA